MNKLLFAVMLCLAGARVAAAQQNSLTEKVVEETSNAAPPFQNTSAARVSLFSVSGEPEVSGTAAVPESLRAFPSEASPASQPKPQPPVGPPNELRWQVAFGVEFLRFQSNFISASMVGTNASVSYLLSDWAALEGNVVTAFAPTIYQNEHVKYFGGGAGVRIGENLGHWEPWGHVLVGGAHLQPQTAAGGRGAFSLQAGLGIDFRLTSIFSLRGQTDYVFTRFFNNHQNNFQAALTGVFHF